MLGNTLKLTIKNDWNDNDYVMEMAIINLLCDFFENELTEDEDACNPERWNDLKELYKYFLPMKDGDLPDAIMNPEEYKLFNSNLLKVVELRGLLWT